MVVVAVQNIPRGMRITEESEAVVMRDWPQDALPEGAFTEAEAIYDKITRVDIKRGMPVLESMVTTTPGDMGESGSDAALQVPAGRVAFALPVAYYSSVAWALQPGDHVDVIISLAFVDLDEEFQSAPPNQIGCISPTEDEGCVGGVFGRIEVLPNGWVVNMAPSEGQRPRLVTQMTVQDAVVLRVGEWPEPGAELEPTPTPVPQEESSDETAPMPTPLPPPTDRVEPVTLAVTRQDAMVLDYAWSVGARINIVLRRSGDTASSTPTEAVTLQYMMDRFAIELPAKLPHGVIPPVKELQRVPRDENAAEYGAPEIYMLYGAEETTGE
jgi:pilus assembly protein CpaB